MISSFKSSNSFGILFIKSNSSWLVFELIKALEIKTSMLFNSDFAYNNSLSCFLIKDLNFLICAFITRIFNPIAELEIPIGIPTKDAKAEI